MLIEAPLNISVIDTDTGGRELHLKFTPEFKALKQDQQRDSFHEFIHYLKTEIDVLEESDPNRHGMLTIQQIAEQLLTHIEANEIPLEDAIVVNIQPDTTFGNILNQS
ncbi:MAG: transcriptional regulator [Gammaproteobacteria bacterium]|nr:transcriptional regulator [Gammaproteobacteria bacterium]